MHQKMSLELVTGVSQVTKRRIACISLANRVASCIKDGPEFWGRCHPQKHQSVIMVNMNLTRFEAVHWMAYPSHIATFETRWNAFLIVGYKKVERFGKSFATSLGSAVNIACGLKLGNAMTLMSGNEWPHKGVVDETFALQDTQSSIDMDELLGTWCVQKTWCNPFFCAVNVIK